MLSETLAGIDSLKAELDALRPLAPEGEQRLWQKLRLEWNYNSNHIEGNTLTYGETFLLLIHGQTNGGHSMREFEEMKAHDVAVSMVRSWADDPERPLLEINLRELNDILLKEPFWKEAITPDGQPTRVQIQPGEYKRQPNNVRLANGEIFLFASVEETPAKIHDLMDWFNRAEDLHPLERAAIFHHRFVAIHPFGDGNGRTARLVINYILMRAGYMPIVIKSTDKSNYLRALQQADAGDLQPFTEYLAEQEVRALELGIKAAKGLSIEEPSDIDKELALFKLGTKDKEGPKEQRTELVLAQTFRKSLRPLFEEFFAGMESFNDFFRAKAFNVKIGSHDLHYNMHDCMRAMSNAFDELEFRARRAIGESVLLSRRTDNFRDLTRDNLETVQATVTFEDYQRAGTNVFSTQTSTKVTFNKYTYVIEVLGYKESRKELLYHQPLTPEDIALFISAAKKLTLANIRSELNT